MGSKDRPKCIRTFPNGCSGDQGFLQRIKQIALTGRDLFDGSEESLNFFIVSSLAMLL